MYRRFVRALYALNILMQALFTLLTPVGIGVLGAWWLVSRHGVGEWIYALLILCGFGCGLFGMIRFLLTAFGTLERIESEQAQKQKQEQQDKPQDADDEPPKA